ncbi:pro-resilin [Procambarus clarkii]|uniref:pro-resilin n=1 Tax=Procambarus clarkii TaxID=6728 RepID=UPI001E67618A|nr:pro-resilin-like [Procambarus clarkii]
MILFSFSHPLSLPSSVWEVDQYIGLVHQPPQPLSCSPSYYTRLYSPSMKVIVLVVAGVVAVSTAPQEYTYDAPGPVSYNFGYTVEAVDAYKQPLQFGHREDREGAKTSGAYYVLLPDTRLMTVNYYVDDTGFHPTYTYEGKAVFPEAYPAGKAAPPSQGNSYNPPKGK